MKTLYLLISFIFITTISYSQAPFITTWEVTDGSLEIAILNGDNLNGYNFSIDFGDGTILNNQTGRVEHIYSTTGTYTISIFGDFPRFFSFPKSKLMTVEQWGDIQWNSFHSTFSNCNNLVINATDAPDLSQVTSLGYMFSGSNNFNQSINHWDVSTITDMSNMFSNCSIYNQPLDNWDVSNVTNMASMFGQATSFNQPLNSWDVSNVTVMSGMFYYAESFNQPIDSWDVSSVLDMNYLFYAANNFNQPLDNWNITNVSDLSGMFENAISFNQPLNSWTTTNVTNINRMFSGSTMFNQSLDNWDISNVNSLQQVFMEATSFNGAIDNWDISNVQQLYEVFKGASSFNQPLNSWNVANVFTMSELFSGASSFNQPLNNWDVSGVNVMALSFNEASSFNQPLDNWDVSNVNDMNQMFNKASSFNQPLENWNVSNVTSMNKMFAEAFNFNQPIDNWNISNVSNINYMFYQTSFNQPLNNWNTSNVQSMTGIFSGATSFNQPLSNWDVSNVYSLVHVFSDAISFNQDVSNWDISNAQQVNYMFNNAHSFNQDISNWQFNDGLYLYNFLNSSGLDSNNYDALLSQFYNLGIYPATLGSTSGLGALGLKYCDVSTRTDLINDFGWSFNGDSLSNECNGVSGEVYFDQDNNGCDMLDIPVNNIFLNANSGNTNNLKLINGGEYVLYTSDNSLTVSFYNLPDYFNATPISSTINFTNSSSQQVDFCLTANQTINDLNITLLPISDARPGFEAEYKLVIENIGTQTVNNISASFVFDDTKQSFVSAVPAENSSATNSLDFSIASLNPFQTQEIDIVMQTFAPPTVNGGDILNFTATVSPNTNDYTPNDNTFSLEQIVVNAFDPNDKRVLQGNTITTDETGDYLNYIIRFQNTGSANATFVRIEDNLDAELDWSTIKMVSSSHDYSVNITNGNEVEFYFDNINLPYEAIDEPGSNGYVAYKIKPITSIQVGDVMSGDASIYFDYNLPIITNTVTTEVISSLSVAEFNLDNLLFIYPNPADKGVFINTKNGVEVNSVRLYTIQGAEFININKGVKFINTENMASGIYVLSIETNKGKVIKKIVIK